MRRSLHENDKVKSSLGLIPRYTMKMYWGVGVRFHASFSSAVDGGGIFVLN
jgi:hypothetical protein